MPRSSSAMIPEPTGGERRIAERRPASLVPAIRGVRLPQHVGDAALVNISTTGALLKTNVRLEPGSPVVVNMEGDLHPSGIPGRVVRCAVTDIDSRGVLWYHIAAVFQRMFTFDDHCNPAGEVREPAVPHAPPETDPIAARNRW